MADLISKQTQGDKCLPLFDFCLLDGAHEWEPDALAFFLVAKLMKPGGWLVMDDLTYNLRIMVPNWRDTPMFADYSERAIDTFQMKMVYDLVIKQHPDFADFHVSHAGRMGWARKLPAVQKINQRHSTSSVPRPDGASQFIVYKAVSSNAAKSSGVDRIVLRMHQVYSYAWTNGLCATYRLIAQHLSKTNK